MPYICLKILTDTDTDMGLKTFTKTDTDTAYQAYQIGIDIGIAECIVIGSTLERWYAESFSSQTQLQLRLSWGFDNL